MLRWGALKKEVLTGHSVPTIYERVGIAASCVQLMTYFVYELMPTPSLAVPLLGSVCLVLSIVLWRWVGDQLWRQQQVPPAVSSRSEINVGGLLACVPSVPAYPVRYLTNTAGERQWQTQDLMKFELVREWRKVDNSATSYALSKLEHRSGCLE